MKQVSVREAKAKLSKLIRLLENNTEDEVLTAGNGRPIVKIVRIHPVPALKRIGAAEGKFVISDGFVAGSEEIAESLMRENLSYWFAERTIVVRFFVR